VLTDPRGFTLYTFQAAPTDVGACTGACRPHWPPVVEGPVAPAGFPCTLGVVQRPDTGDRQVTCNGKLLYLSDTDTVPGTTNGNLLIVAPFACFSHTFVGHNNGFGFISAKF
jgi:predicted lipoprotein with Yx(FWY)xxD motif